MTGRRTTLYFTGGARPESLIRFTVARFREPPQALRQARETSYELQRKSYMALSPPVEREHQHTRQFDFQGFARSDGLWDIEGHMTDVKPYGFPNDFRGHIEAGEPLHDMWIRLTIDEDFLIHAIEAVTDAGPYQICPAITPNFQNVVGLRIGPGWRPKLRSRVGGVKGCTHLVEMLTTMATVAYQTLYPTLAKKRKKNPAPETKPALLNSCHTFSSDGEVARKSWPAFYTGAQANDGE